MTVPSVSVVIPTYNRAHLLGRAIKSVLDQTYTDFELIVVDDGSTDGTSEVVKSFNDSRLRFIRTEPNRGASAARNTGIQAAQGEYIAFNDSDDEWLPQKLEKQVKFFEENARNGHLGVVLCELIRITPQAEQYVVVKPELINVNDLLVRLYCQCGTPGFLLKRAVVKTELYFDESLPAYQDWDLLARMSRICEVESVHEPLFRVYQHQENRIWTSRSALNGRLLLLKKYDNELQALPKLRNYHHKFIGLRYYDYGEMNEARRYFRSAIKAYPWDIGAYLYYGAALLGHGGLRYFIYAIKISGGGLFLKRSLSIR